MEKTNVVMIRRWLARNFRKKGGVEGVEGVEAGDR